jgi:hypothetical protein
MPERDTFFTFVWSTTGEKEFEEKVALLSLVESVTAFRPNARLVIVVLEGYDHFSTEYRRKLSSAYTEILDYGTRFQALAGEYQNLFKFYSSFEAFCFLRWIVLKRLVEDLKIHGQVWHLDSDVRMLVSLDELAEDTRGKTFMLQGCPVLLSVVDREWLTVYERELRQLDTDIEGYSQTAFAMKDMCRENDRELCNQSLYRNPIGSDQDLLEFLVSSKKIVQASSREIFRSRFYFAQNLLQMGQWDDFQAPDGRNAVRVRDGQIMVGERRMPLVHFQNNFSMVCAVYLASRGLGMGLIPVPARLLRYTITETMFRFNPAARGLLLLTRLFPGQYTRNIVIRRMSATSKGVVPIVELLNVLRRAKR